MRAVSVLAQRNVIRSDSFKNQNKKHKTENHSAGATFDVLTSMFSKILKKNIKSSTKPL